MSAIEIDITFQSPLWPQRLDSIIRDTITQTLALSPLSFKEAEISVVLADNDFIQTLNKNYRGQDKPTNVLSFPQMEPDELEDTQDEFVSLGDVILAYETVEIEVSQQNKSFDEHVMHLLVHGTLHLLGYDHIENHEAEEMEALEIEILKQIGVKNPYEFDKVVS